jgi:antimicrobial peptide system SdpA family protein
MKKIIFFSVNVIFAAFIILFILLNSVKQNPISLEYGIDNEMTSLVFPQGWSFFSKDPREATMNLFSIENGVLRKIDFKNTQAKNLYGLKKSDRLIYYKIYGDVQKFPIKHFYNSRDNINSIDLKKINTYSLKNTTYKKGKYLAQIVELESWVWFSKLKNKVNMPARYVLLKIES